MIIKILIYLAGYCSGNDLDFYVPMLAATLTLVPEVFHSFPPSLQAATASFQVPYNSLLVLSFEDI
jgi:hypothetical protein